nr:hypothetical protein [Tanacetum cinerariifolium]
MRSWQNISILQVGIVLPSTNNDEEHYVQYKEYLENSSTTIAATNFNQEKEELPQNSNIRQLIREEYGIKVCEKQKQNMEDTMLELLEVCRQKSFIEKQEAKNIVEQPTKHETRIAESLKNFRVKKSSTSLNNMSQISPVNAITPVLPTEEPEYSLSMGEYECIFDNIRDVPICEDSSTFDILKDQFEILSESNDDDTSSDDDAFEDIDQDVILHEKLLSINRLIADIEFLNDNPTPDRVLKSSSSFPIFEKSDNFLSYSDNSLPKFETFSDHTEETRSGNTTTHANNPLLEYDSFCFEIEPDQGRLTSVVMNDFSDNSTNDSFERGDIHFLKELLVNDSIPFLENESSNFDHHDDPLFPRPPPEPPDIKFFFDVEPNSKELIAAVMRNIDELNEDECFDPGGEIDVFANVKDDD